jgi:hypothetical protein
MESLNTPPQNPLDGQPPLLSDHFIPAALGSTPTKQRVIPMGSVKHPLVISQGSSPHSSPQACKNSGYLGNDAASQEQEDYENSKTPDLYTRTGDFCSPGNDVVPPSPISKRVMKIKPVKGNKNTKNKSQKKGVGGEVNGKIQMFNNPLTTPLPSRCVDRVLFDVISKTVPGPENPSDNNQKKRKGNIYYRTSKSCGKRTPSPHDTDIIDNFVPKSVTSCCCKEGLLTMDEKKKKKKKVIKKKSKDDGGFDLVQNEETGKVKKDKKEMNSALKKKNDKQTKGTYSGLCLPSGKIFFFF